MVETTSNNGPNFKEQLDTQIVQDIESGQAGTSAGGAPAPTTGSTSAAAARDDDNDVMMNGPNFKHQCQDVAIPQPQQTDHNNKNGTTTSTLTNPTTSNGEEPPIAMALPVVVEEADKKNSSSLSTSDNTYNFSIAKETVIKCLLLIIVLFLLVGVVVGGVCGSGLCSSSDSGKSKNDKNDNKKDGKKNNSRSGKNNKNDNNKNDNNNQGPPPTPTTRSPTFPPVTAAPTAAPVTAAPTQAPTTDDGKCQSDADCNNTDSSSSLSSICLDETCCTECRRVLLTSVFTDDDGVVDGAGGNVEPQFYINDQQVYPINGGIGSLAPQTRIFFPEPLPQLGNIHSTNVNLDFGAFEKDDGDIGGIINADPDDNDFVTIPNSQWYFPQERTPYDLSTTLGGWVFHYTVQTECCSNTN